MEHHPDKGGDVSKFQEITNAYETLSDPNKKAQYDNPQARQHNFGMHPNGFNPFEDIFSQFNMHVRTPKNRDLNVIAKIDLKDVMNGKKLIVSYRLRSGKQETVELDIPVGARDNDTVRYNGLGDDGDPRFPRGDLYVKIRVLDLVDWKRDGNNLYTKKQIDLFDIMLGCVIMIETLDNKTVQLTIPKGTKPGTTFSIPDYGIPDLHTKRRGKIFVQVDVSMPDMSNDLIYQKITELNNLLKKDSN